MVAKKADKRVLPDWHQLWAAWEELSAEEKEALKSGSDAELDAKLSGMEVTETTPKISLKDRADLRLKLEIYKEVVNLFADSQDVKEDRFDKLLKELKGVGMRSFDISKRAERANEGKEAANKKYKDGNWFGAMYTYAIAWGCLVPFYSAALADTDGLKKDIEKLEVALFSNISAMAVHGAEDKTMKTPKPINKGKLMHVGLRASVYCLSQADKTTVGIVSKSCRRAYDLSAKLTSRNSIKATTPANIQLWKDQEAALVDVPITKSFLEVEKDKKKLQGSDEWMELKGFEIYTKK